MTTAFIAEVDTAGGTMYLATKSKLSKVPFFFRSVSHMSRSLIGTRYRSASDYYTPTRDALKTTIVKVENLERGLRASSGTRMTVAEFNAIPRRVKEVAPSPNTVFKIQYQSVGVGRKRFAGDGKFGKIWNRQGDLRNHITLNISRLKSQYREATVVMITMNDDGVSTKSIVHVPIVDWYRRTECGNKSYMNAFPSSITTDLPVSRSTYA